MTDTPFEGIFYPSRIEAEPKADRPLSRPAAIIVPDAAFGWVEEETRRGYGSVPGIPERILILSPLHQSVRPESGDAVLFAPLPGDFCHAPLDEAFLAGQPGIVRDDAYFQEEPAPSMEAAVCHAYYPAARLAPVLVSAETDARGCRMLAGVIDRFCAEAGSLVVVSCNACALETEPGAWKAASAFLHDVVAHGPLLDDYHKHIVTSLGSPIVAALDRSRTFGGQEWQIGGVSVRGRHFDAMPPQPAGTKERLTWHAELEGAMHV